MVRRCGICRQFKPFYSLVPGHLPSCLDHPDMGSCSARFNITSAESLAPPAVLNRCCTLHGVYRHQLLPSSLSGQVSSGTLRPFCLSPIHAWHLINQAADLKSCPPRLVACSVTPGCPLYGFSVVGSTLEASCTSSHRDQRFSITCSSASMPLELVFSLLSQSFGSHLRDLLCQ